MSICWQPHGGGNVNITFTEIMDMDVQLFSEVTKTARQFREEEVRAIERAHRRT